HTKLALSATYPVVGSPGRNNSYSIPYVSGRARARGEDAQPAGHSVAPASRQRPPRPPRQAGEGQGRGSGQASRCGVPPAGRTPRGTPPMVGQSEGAPEASQGGTEAT